MTSSLNFDNSESPFPAHYQVEQITYQGANVTIYRGINLKEDGKEVILKCFPPSGQNAYLREMAAAFGIKHTHINYCLDTFCLTDGQTCMVYEYITGGTLRRWLEEHGPLDLFGILRCLHDLLKALQYLHSLKIIHCDLKPENVLVRVPTTGELQFVLSDLGAAAFIREAQQGRHTTGSPAYIAPERLYDRFSYNSDLYSLGILGFELLTGHRPFDGSAAEISRAHLSQLPATGEIQHSLLRDFIERLLEKDPKTRLPTTEAALQILECIEQGNACSSDREVVTTLQPIAPVSCSQYAIKFNQLHPITHLSLAKRPQNLWVLHTQGIPFLGLDYQSHIEWIQPPNTTTHQIILSAAPIQILNHYQVAYTTGTRIAIFEVGKPDHRHIYQAGKGLVGFHLQGDNLLWYTNRGGHLCDLVRGLETTYRSNSYVLNPQGCLLANGHFFTSGGPFNNQAILRDEQTNILVTWTLDGPLLACTCREDKALALTLNLESEQQYTLWSIDPKAIPPLQKLPLPGDIKHWYFTPGHLFWLTLTAKLYYCTNELQINFVGQLPLQTHLTNFSPNHHFFVTLTTNSYDANAITVWENQPNAVV
jgi:serine/threonine protein kinase